MKIMYWTITVNTCSIMFISVTYLTSKQETDLSRFQAHTSCFHIRAGVNLDCFVFFFFGFFLGPYIFFLQFNSNNNVWIELVKAKLVL